MASLNEQYTRELKEEVGYLATWLPTVPVAPGDVGILTNYEFQKVGTLKDMGIEFSSTEPRAKGSFAYQSKDAVAIETKVAGQAPPGGSTLAQADAGIVVQFSREKAVAFKADGCQSIMLGDLESIGAAVLALYRAGSWPADYVVVTEAVSASSTTALISNGNQAKIELRATAKVEAAQLSLANAEAKFVAQNESKMGLSMVAEGSLTPLFRANGVRRRLLRPPVFREGVMVPGDEFAFAAVDYDDFAGR